MRVLEMRDAPEDLVEYFKRESVREEEYSKSLEETASKSRNLMLKTVMKAVSLDSLKHSYLYRALAEMLENPSLIAEEESEKVLEEIKRHIEEEREAVEELERLLKDERIKENPAAKFIVEMMLKDEKFHHALLLRLYEAVVKHHTLTERDIWEMVWQDAIWHGAPGG